MYMSYCRYEGTFAELRVCLEDVDEHIYGMAEYGVSDHEIKEFRNMVERFVGWMQETELLDEDGELDQERLDEVCEAMGNAKYIPLFGHGVLRV